MAPPSLNIKHFIRKPSFRKDVRRLDKVVLKDLERALHDMMGEVPPGRKFKKLTASSTYSIRVCGSYRMSFEIDGNTAILRRIGPRQTFYDSY